MERSRDATNKLVWFPHPRSGFAVGQLIDIGQTNATIKPIGLPAACGPGIELIDGSAEPKMQEFNKSQEFAYESLYPCDQLDAGQLTSSQHASRIGPIRDTIATANNNNNNRSGSANTSTAQAQPDWPDVDDCCALIQLHEAALLENVRLRFHRDKIYTYVAHILIAVNPYFQIQGLHSAETIRKYQGKSLGTMPPHVFAIADKAYRDMKAFKRSQSIIISGESGAGKTESQKYVLRYLCLSGGQSGRLEKLILDANPLLEAFGNAKTTRNNNSSRFGKFIEIHYSAKFQVIGGLFYHYLLEKSRICTQSSGERNYHIFYQLCACLPEKQWRQLELGSPDQFRYLNSGCTRYFSSSDGQDRAEALENQRKSRDQSKLGPIRDQLIDDFSCFQQTDNALANFGLNEEQKFAIYSIVAAVLHLGNIEFCDLDSADSGGPSNNDTQSSRKQAANNGSGCKVRAHSEQALGSAARLIGLDAQLLRQALISRIMSTARGGHKGTVYMVQLNAQQASSARDALAKSIYAKLFDHLVRSIVNKSIPIGGKQLQDEQRNEARVTSSQLITEVSKYYIGVLDVAGFEYFRHNDFEQFLINFCNEKLQQFFNQRILKEEQCIYEMEGLNLPRVDYIDNSDCIRLFEMKSSGLFDLLDEESRLPRPSASHFTQSVHLIAGKQQQQQQQSGKPKTPANNNNTTAHLALPRTSRLHRDLRDDEGFLIRHFAGSVCYESRAFIEKNNDALHGSLKLLMLEAENDLLRELFSSQLEPAGPDREPKLVGPPAPRVTTNYQQQATGVGSNGNKLSFVSVATTFRTQLAELMDKLQSTGSHFIRCIKPNSDMVEHKFEGAQILNQLHCSGMDSVLKLMQQGYPSRVSFNDLYQAYAASLPAKLARLEGHQFCRCLFKAIGLADQDFRFGASKVFFKPGKFAEFDELIRTADAAHVNELVARVSRWLIRWRWRQLQFCSWSVVKLRRKLVYRREMVLRVQRIWRGLLVRRQVQFCLDSVRCAKQLAASLRQFEQLAETDELGPATSEESAALRSVMELEGKALLGELDEFMGSLAELIRGRLEAPRAGGRALELERASCRERLELLRTKRDLLVRTQREQLLAARTRRATQLTAELDERLASERQQVERAELARRQDSELRRQRAELELRRQRRLAAAGQSGQSDQSSQSRALAMGRRRPLAPSENLAHASQLELASRAADGLDLSSWKYCDLRDTINTSCDLELLEACKREFHRRLKVYHAWRAANSAKGSSAGSPAPAAQAEAGRAPSCILELARPDHHDGGPPDSWPAAGEQRYFRIPFLRGRADAGGPDGRQRGWWFAHFDGQWIARQLELHPNRAPILLVAGQHDIDMCELSLDETRLASKRGAEIPAQEFEAEWRKHGGQPYPTPGRAGAERHQ